MALFPHPNKITEEISDKPTTSPVPPLETPCGVYTWSVSSRESFDPELYQQILIRYRSDWPNGFRGVNEDRTWIALPSDNPLHIALVSQDAYVASHAAFVSRVIKIGDVSYNACGIIGLFTQQGHVWLAPRIIHYVSTVLIPASGADIAMGFCEEGKLVRWYERLGLSPIRDARVRVDSRNDDSTIVDDEVLMAAALTERGNQGLGRVREGNELYFGSRPTW